MSDAAGVAPAEPPAPESVSLAAIFRTFLWIGATSFGGGVVAYLRDYLVTRRGWLDDDDFVEALEVSQAMPGLNTTNMSVIVGDRLRGPRGALVAFLGITLPGAAVVLALGVLYGAHAHRPAVTTMLDGVNAAAVALLLAVTLQIGRREVRGLVDVALALVTCVAVSVLHVSLVVVLATVGPLAVWLHRPPRESHE